MTQQNNSNNPLNTYSKLLEAHEKHAASGVYEFDRGKKPSKNCCCKKRPDGAGAGRPYWRNSCNSNSRWIKKVRSIIIRGIHIFLILKKFKLGYYQNLPEGGILSPREFLHLGSRAAVDQTFSRLAKQEQLLRIGKGLYTPPVQGRFGMRPPATENFLTALGAVSK